jgi:N6-adenosine-specific RNA methylase IME4
MNEAYKAIKTEEKKAIVQEQIQVLKEKEVQPSTGFYDVIVIDPPWHMEKIERDVAPNQVGFDYPTMTIEEIKDMDLPAEENCHVFMWITQKHHRHGFDIFDAWGVNFICEFVWHKNGGFQPFGLPQFNHEYVMYGRIGTPTFIDFKNFFTCFNANRTGHSAKPEEFYETIRRVTAGKRIDIFNRRKIEGYDTWGNQAV